MRELGVKSDYFHRQIIELVANLKLTKVIFIGDEFYKFKKRFDNFIFYMSYVPAIKYLNKDVSNIKNIFIMGSRSNHLDRIIKKYAR